MELRTIELINKLSDDIKKRTEYIEFALINEQINNNIEVAKLANLKEKAIMEYEDALNHYDKNSPEVLECSKKMSETIYNLNNNELVKLYNIKLEKLNKLLKEIDKELFSFLYD